MFVIISSFLFLTHIVHDTKPQLICGCLFVLMVIIVDCGLEYVFFF